MALEDFFNITAKVLRSSSSTNSLSDGVVSWAVNSTIEGMLDFYGGQSGGEVRIAAQYANNVSHIFMCSSTVDVTNKDKLQIDSEDYRVLYVDNPLNMDMQKEILLQYVGVDT